MKRNTIAMLAILILFVSTSSVTYGLYETTHPWPTYRNSTSRSGHQPVSTPNTNSTLWSWSVPSGATVKNPVIAEGVVYVAQYDDLYAIDETTGAQLWTVDVNGGSSSSYIGDRGPTVSDGKLYVGDKEGFLWCLNATNGQEIWHWPISVPPGDINTSPVAANGRVYFGTADGDSGNNYLVALDATTGEREWWYTAPDNSILSSPAVDGTWIFFGCDDGKVYALNDTGNVATLKWSKTTQGRVRSTPCVYEDKLFFGSSNIDHSVFAVNKTTGQSIWNFTLTSHYEIAYSLAVANDVVYFASPSRYVYALNASVTPGSYGESSMEIILWRSLHFTEGTLRSPAVTDDKVFLTASNVLYALDINNGLKLWSYDLYAVYDEGPVVADGRIFVTDYTDLHCFGDFYPPNMYHHPVVGTGYEFIVEIVANATCQVFDYSNLESEMKLAYTLDANWNINHIVMSNITIPHDMLGGAPYVLTVDGGGPNSIEFDSNATHTTIHFTYLHESHDSHDIEITGTSVIPEFSPITILPLLVTLSLVTLALLKRKMIGK